MSECSCCTSSSCGPDIMPLVVALKVVAELVECQVGKRISAKLMSAST